MSRVSNAKRRRRGRRKRSPSPQRLMILTVIDQGTSSISNFALSLAVAHYSTASGLGVFAVLTTTYILSQGIVRSVTSDCLLTRAETNDKVMLQFERGGYLTAVVVATALAALIAA